MPPRLATMPRKPGHGNELRIVPDALFLWKSGFCASRVRTKPIKNLARLAELVDVDPFVDGMRLVDRTGSEHDCRNACGGDS